MKTVDLSGKPFHFIGIGGIGMSALAYVMAKRQLPVSGSDLRSSHITERLKSVGAHIFNQQAASNLQFFQQHPSAIAANNSSLKSATTVATAPDLPQVVCSTAIRDSNLEYQAAKSLDCEILHRSDVLAALIKDYQSIAVSGTHGKTTTSSLIGFMLLKAGVDPTIIVGGEVDEWQGNARLGAGKWLVAEADESDGSLVKHSPAVGIVTNIELDHPDHYQNLEAVVQTFKTFASQCQTVIGCIDDPVVNEQIQPDVSYSIESLPADYQVRQVNYGGLYTEAEVWEQGQPLGKIKLSILGKHNLSNALAAVAVGRLVGLSIEEIAAALAEFRGTKRRFEVKGRRNNIVLVDDYAHHPTEIRVTLAAARQTLQENPQLRRVVSVFQPHRYSRTHHFLDQFAEAFTDADCVIITDIYSAGEKNTWQISGQDLAMAIAKYHPSVSFQPLDCLQQFLIDSVLKPGDLTLFLGAGNLNQIIPQVLEKLP